MAESELVVSVQFDYKTLDKDEAGKLRCLSSDIQKLRAAIAVNIMDVGKSLCAAQEVLSNHGNGTFLQFVESEGFSKSAAYNYMAAYRVFGDIPTAARMEDVAMYALASNSTPEKALKEALKLADKGTKITHKLAREIIKKHTEPKGDQDEDPEEEVEDEPEVEEEPTLAEICEADNRAIESFCRVIVKQFENEVPKTPWTQDSGRIESAIAALKSGLTTLRGAKADVCPACVEGKTEKGKCRYCKGHGYLPTYQAKAIPEDARL